MQLHKLACSYLSLHAVTWACMQLHELACSSLSWHAFPSFVWAAHKNFAVLVSYAFITVYFLAGKNSNIEELSPWQLGVSQWAGHNTVHILLKSCCRLSLVWHVRSQREGGASRGIRTRAQTRCNRQQELRETECKIRLNLHLRGILMIYREVFYYYWPDWEFIQRYWTYIFY